MSGTSMSAPHVAGIAALLLQRNPKLTSAQIRSALIASANPPAGVDPFDIAWGYGRVDAEATINLIR
jgi:subtilisin family serine protease